MARSGVLAGVSVGVSVCVAAATALAQDHNHITVDTDGSRVVLDTGYLPDETGFAIGPDGWVTFEGERLVRESLAEWTGTPLTGWQLGAETVLTSDFYAATGRLDGGDFWIEIAGFDFVGGDRESDFAWATRDRSVLESVGQFSAGTREGRSYYVGNNRHPHGQVWLAERPGLYALTLIAWDANGVYADSEPVQMYIRSVPGPGGAGVLACLGMGAAVRRRRR
ncbi:MAG: hypothetical protein ACF8LK_00220 [Phycisphaerales bacterium JB041]